MANCNELAASLMRIYRFFVDIGYLHEEEMRWPDKEPSALDIDLCRAVGIDDIAIDLIKQLPWTRSATSIQFTPGTQFLDWSEEGAIRASRFPTYPTLDEDEAGLQVIPGTCISLAFMGCSGFGSVPVLDVRTSKLKENATSAVLEYGRF